MPERTDQVRRAESAHVATAVGGQLICSCSWSTANADREAAHVLYAAHRDAELRPTLFEALR